MRVLPFFKGGPHLGHKKILSIKKSLLVINLRALRSLHNHPVLLSTVLGHSAQCWFREKDSSHEHFVSVSSVLGFSTGVPSKLLGLVEANTSLRSGMDTNANNDKTRSSLLVFAGTLIHFRRLSHTYTDRSSLSFPDTSLSKASPALVNWAAPSSFSLE